MEVCFLEAFAGDLLIPSYNETYFAFDELAIVFLVLSSSEGTKYLDAGSGTHNFEDFVLLEADVFFVECRGPYALSFRDIASAKVLGGRSGFISGSRPIRVRCFRNAACAWIVSSLWRTMRFCIMSS